MGDHKWRRFAGVKGVVDWLKDPSQGEKPHKQRRKHEPYNHDIHVLQSTLDQYPTLRGVLDAAPIGELFDAYDEAARRLKKRMELFGTIALAIGIMSLIGVLFEIAARDLGYYLATWQLVTVEFGCLVSLGIFFFSRRQRYRSYYLDACFARERLRQLRFQLFLNGPLIERVVAREITPQAALDPFLAKFEDTARNLPGARDTFIGGVPSSAHMLVTAEAYKDEAVAAEVFNALEQIRFAHQLQYVKRRLAKSPADGPVSLKERYEWSESAAMWCLVAALVIPAIQLVLAFKDSTLSDSNLAFYHSWLSVIAIAMVIVSVGVRAYQGGMGVPDEIESYESYASHVESLQEQFSNKHLQMNMRLYYLQELELEAERELRRFLAIKSKATFLF